MGKTKLVVIILTILSITLFYSFVWAQESEEPASRQRPPVAVMVLDLIIVRPISVAVSAASTIFCAGTMPLAYPIGVGEQSTRIFIEAPWRFTGMRHLGEFGSYKDGKPITVIERP